MKDKLHTYFKELQSLTKRTWELQDAVDKEVSIFTQDNRELQKGDKVEVFLSHDNSSLGFGIIGAAKVFIKGNDCIQVEVFSANAEEIEIELKRIFYEVFAVKKDGTASAKHFFDHPHYMPMKIDKYSDYYLKKIS